MRKNTNPVTSATEAGALQPKAKATAYITKSTGAGRATTSHSPLTLVYLSSSTA